MKKSSKPPSFYSLNSAVVFCFFLSGAAGLVYQVLWARMIDKVVGSAPFSVAAVLSVFMGGLALGSYLAGKRIDRIPSKSRLLFLYGKLELAIGFYGLLLPLILLGFKPIYVLAYDALFEHFFWYQLFSFFGCAALLLIPTTLMGMTLPILCRFYVTGLGHLGLRTGRLYGINTFGAVAGALLCGFYLIARLGVFGSLLTAVGINLLVGALSIGMAKRYAGVIDSDTAGRDKGRGATKGRKVLKKVPEAVSTGHGRIAFWALCIFFSSGFCAMAYEVFWTRLLGLIIGPTTYSFTLVVAAFIVGLALGSILFGWLADRVKGTFGLLAATQVSAACLALGISQFLGNSQFFFSKLIYVFRDDFGEMMLVKSLVLFLILIGPTIFLGGAFPLVNKIYTRSLSTLGKSIGGAYAVNTVGAILGSFAAGYVLIPLVGKENGLRLVIALQAAVAVTAVAALDAGKLRKAGAWLALLTVVVLGGVSLAKFPSWNRSVLSGGWYHRYDELQPHFQKSSWIEAAWKGSSILARYKGGTSELVFYGDGIGGFTTVEEEIDSMGAAHYSLYNSGKADASTHPGDRSTQALLAHVPLLFHPNPENVMVLGLASGMTAGEALLYPVERVDVLEISDQVLEACRYFTPWNNNCLANPVVNLIVQDGRNHLELTRKAYDVIISEPSNPWMAGLANLFTLELFETVKGRLSEDGIFVQWIHSYEMDWAGFAMVGRTFAAVFPDGLLMKTSPSDFLLVGFKGEKKLDPETAENNIPYAKRSTNISIRDATSFFRLIVTEDLEGFFGTGPLHTDNRPRLEFAAPRNLDKFDPSIAERVAHTGRLSEETAAVLAAGNTVDTSLDMLELSLAQSSPLFDIVDLENATPDQAERYGEILTDYCSQVFVNNYDMFPSEGLKVQCARLQVEQMEANMAGGRRDATDCCNLAVAYRILGDIEAETALLRKAVSLDPHLYSARNDLGIVLSRQGMLGEAAVQLSEALRIKPGDAEALNNLGNVLASQGRSAEARGYYARALQEVPGDVEVLGNLGNVLAAQGKVDQAVNYYARALRLNPDYAEAHHKLGHIYVNKGKFDDAMVHFSELLRIDPDDADLHSEVGSILASRGRTSEAEKHFKAALGIDPDHLSANYNLGLALAEQGRLEAAGVHLSKAVAVNPDDAAAHNALGVVLGSSGRTTDAAYHFSRAVKLNPDDAKMHDNLGLALLQLGRIDEAADHFSKALELDGSFDTARKHLALALRQKGKSQ